MTRAYAVLTPVTVQNRIVYRETPFTGTARPGDVLTVRLDGGGLARLALPGDRGSAAGRRRVDAGHHRLPAREADRRDWWWGSRVEYRDQRTVFFQEGFEQGRYEYLYFVKVTSAGTFRAAPGPGLADVRARRARVVRAAHADGRGAGWSHAVIRTLAATTVASCSAPPSWPSSTGASSTRPSPRWRTLALSALLAVAALALAAIAINMVLLAWTSGGCHRAWSAAPCATLPAGVLPACSWRRSGGSCCAAEGGCSCTAARSARGSSPSSTGPT